MSGGVKSPTVELSQSLSDMPAPRASLLRRQSNSAQVVCLWHRLFRDTVKNGLKNQPAGAESCVASKIDRLARGRRRARRLFCRNGGAIAALRLPWTSGTV